MAFGWFSDFLTFFTWSMVVERDLLFWDMVMMTPCLPSSPFPCAYHPAFA
jgi:hypothetical protein